MDTISQDSGHEAQTSMQETAVSDQRISRVTNNSPPSAKIELFRSLFRGREDVYPRRFESRKTGKSGYAPACANEWIRGVCEKPRIKCTECPNRRFFQITDEVIGWHLSGRDDRGVDFVMGVYAMLQDETCFFLAVDFDGKDWQPDAATFRETCRRLDVPVVLERSRSGDGGHVWFFFEDAIPASLARKLGSHILTETMEHRPEIGLHSYDRLFPNQDTLPKGGFGNLIALPLQKQARQRGNTVFLDEQLRPYIDQWAFLASVRRMSRAQVEARVRDAESKGRIVGVRMAMSDEDDENPWTAPPSRRRKESPIDGALPEQLEVILGDQIYIGKENLVPALRNRLLRLAAFQNPEFYRAQSMRLPTHDKPRIIACAEDHPKHFALPRGCLDEVLETLEALKIQPVLHDERFGGNPLSVSFTGALRPEQQLAAEAILRHDTGVLAATTAFGKTVVAAWLIAQRGVNTLILVHRQQLLEQWIERLSSFLSVPAKGIGRLGGGRKKLTGALDVALMQSLVRKEIVDDRVAGYGNLIVDECHHISARSFELVVRRAKAKFVTGLSATVTRKDGHHPIIFMQCGPIRHRVDAKAQAAARPFTHQVLVRPTGFRATLASDPDPRAEFHELYEALWNDNKRNEMMCADVVSAVNQGRSPLVLTERTGIVNRFLDDGLFLHLIVEHHRQVFADVRGGRARACAHRRAGDAAARRAAVESRRQSARRNALRGPPPARRIPLHHGLRHPRPVRSHDDRRRHRRDECRPDRAGRLARGHLRPSALGIRRPLHRFEQRDQGQEPRRQPYRIRRCRVALHG